MVNTIKLICQSNRFRHELTFLHELRCAPQSCGHSSTGGHSGSSPHPGLLVLQEEEWVQNNQGETTILPLMTYSYSMWHVHVKNDNDCLVFSGLFSLCFYLLSHN